MGDIRSFRDLIAWQKAFALGLEIYHLTQDFPDSERFGLTSQLRRGAVSIASNIAEGYGRGSTADYLRFLRVSRGALYDIDTQLLFAAKLAFMSDQNHTNVAAQVDEVGRLLAGLIKSIESHGASA